MSNDTIKSTPDTLSVTSLSRVSNPHQMGSRLPKEPFVVLSERLGPTLAKMLVKRFLGDEAAAIGGTIIDIISNKITNARTKRAAARQFEDLADRICDHLLPAFQYEIQGEDVSIEAVANQIGQSMQSVASSELLLANDMNPARLEAAARRIQPLRSGQFTATEIEIYNRALAMSMRYLVGVAKELPRFDASLAAETLQRLSSQSASIEQTLEAIQKIESRLLVDKDVGSDDRFEADYRQAVLTKLDFVELFGADISPESQRHSLSVAYISLNLEYEAEAGAVPIDTALNSLSKTGDRLLIRGNAGSGKSTLLRWIALEAARGLDEREVVQRRGAFLRGSSLGRLSDHDAKYVSIHEQEFLGRHSEKNWRSRVPLLVRLRDCPDGSLPSIDDFAEQVVGHISSLPTYWVQNILLEKRGIILLDGVDEIPNYKRDEIRQELESLVERFPGNTVVVTSRPAAVPPGWLRELDFVEANVNPLSRLDRDRFIDKWHEAVGHRLQQFQQPDGGLGELAHKLKTALLGNHSVARLATNPLLCAMICALHRDRSQKLPSSQAELCEALCHMLLHRREEESGLNLNTFPEAYTALRYEQKRALVQDLAHYMVLNEEQALPIDKVNELLKQSMELFPDQKGADPASLRKVLIERSGILREQRPGWVDFIHNTFKEYLAAERFADGTHVGLLAKKALDATWRPVVLFAVASRTPGFATELVSRLLRLATESCEGSAAREYRLAALGCRPLALYLRREEAAQLQEIEHSLFPPSTVADAEAIANSGDATAGFLRYDAKHSNEEIRACIRALRLMGTEAAAVALRSYCNEVEGKSAVELSQAINPLEIKWVLDRLLGGEKLPFGVREQIFELGPLLRKIDIKELDLSNSSVSDISIVGKLHDLRSLSLGCTQVKDLRPLSNLRKLETLELWGTSITDLRPLENLGALRNLILFESKVRGVVAISRIRGLTTLDLAETAVSNVNPLRKLTNLRSLDIANTQVDSVRDLNKCKMLKELFVSGLTIDGVAELRERGVDVIVR